ncbi:hypothetical protein XELAEV_18000553mg [Xenopus laevis]|nr:hypothetical protein XELAEV_18000553mg [Xenopus laevis]
MEVVAQESLLCVQNEVAESLADSVADSVAPVTDRNECEHLERGRGRSERERPGQENASEESVTQEAGVEVEQVGHIASQSDQVQQRVEIESIQVGGVDETANSFWGKRRLFANPDVSHDNQPFKRKHWVKIKWDGEKEQVPSRRFLVRTDIMDSMGCRHRDLSAVITQTKTDFDVTFKLQETLEHFWIGNQNPEHFVVIPMTKPETKNITIVTKNHTIPYEDILLWLRRCFKCGAINHLAKSCAVLRCALCNAIGHVADACVNVRCNLCNRRVHRSCPEAYHKIVTLFPEVDKEMMKDFVTPERETMRTNRKENTKPVREISGKAVRSNTNKEGKKDENSWQTVNTKNKNQNAG